MSFIGSPEQHVDQKLCFVLMPFDGKFADVHQVIKAAVKEYGG